MRLSQKWPLLPGHACRGLRGCPKQTPSQPKAKKEKVAKGSGRDLMPSGIWQPGNEPTGNRLRWPGPSPHHRPAQDRPRRWVAVRTGRTYGYRDSGSRDGACRVPPTHLKCQLWRRHSLGPLQWARNLRAEARISGALSARDQGTPLQKGRRITRTPSVSNPQVAPTTPINNSKSENLAPQNMPGCSPEPLPTGAKNRHLQSTG